MDINSVQEFLEVLEGFEEDGFERWYRGQRVSEWKLLPGYMRLQNPPSETTLLNRFRQNAARLIEAPARNDFDWMFLMQHYGVPTRLLDWSENPLTALYFSSFPSPEDEQDGALWVLKPVLLNSLANISNSDEPNYLPSFDDPEIEGYTLQNVSSNPRISLKPAATIATRNNARIQAQAGVFTIHHKSPQAIEDLEGEHVQKLVIPAASKIRVRRQLKSLGFTRFHLFPELESVGATVREGLE